jgi:hypothetical protein
MVLDFICFPNVVEPLGNGFFFYKKMLELAYKSNIVLPKKDNC